MGLQAVRAEASDARTHRSGGRTENSQQTFLHGVNGKCQTASPTPLHRSRF